MSTFDDQVQAKLQEQLDSNTAAQIGSAYAYVNSHIAQEVLSHIRGKEPSLTDHDMTHIENVKENALSLLNDDDLTGVEMYLLGMFILFHDAGNILGRFGHQNEVGDIFDNLRPGSDGHARHEKSLVVTATRAHTGSTDKGSRDTLQPISENDQHLGKRVRLRELSAVLRFADELAEGPQRTSKFAQRIGYYEDDARIYHAYANSTNILIDRLGGRIELSYEIELGDFVNSSAAVEEQVVTAINFFYSRLIKLNQERQYAIHYSKMLERFRATYAKFTFHYHNKILETDLEPLSLTDLVVPGEPSRKISDLDPRYGIDSIVPTLLARMED